MTEPSEKEIEKFQRVLAAAHRAQSPPPLPPDWRASVMRAIRTQQAARGRGDIALAVWRAAAMIALVSMALIGSAITWTHMQPQEDLSLLTAYAVDFSLAGEP